MLNWPRGHNRRIFFARRSRMQEKWRAFPTAASRSASCIPSCDSGIHPSLRWIHARSRYHDAENRLSRDGRCPFWPQRILIPWLYGKVFWRTNSLVFLMSCLAEGHQHSVRNCDQCLATLNYIRNHTLFESLADCTRGILCWQRIAQVMMKINWYYIGDVEKIDRDCAEKRIPSFSWWVVWRKGISIL